MNNYTGEPAEKTPLLRIWLCGSFQMEWVDPTTGAILPSEKAPGGGRDWVAALSLFALLLCQPNRQAHRDWVMEQFWPEGSREVAIHRLENIFSCLRNRQSSCDITHTENLSFASCLSTILPRQASA